jgi:hypothetical protein
VVERLLNRTTLKGASDHLPVVATLQYRPVDQEEPDPFSRALGAEGAAGICSDDLGYVEKFVQTAEAFAAATAPLVKATQTELGAAAQSSHGTPRPNQGFDWMGACSFVQASASRARRLLPSAAHVDQRGAEMLMR